MKKFFIVVFAVLSISAFAQLPSNNPSFTVSQQVGSSTAEFIFKRLSFEDPIENFIAKGKTFYPGGRSYFILRFSKDISAMDIAISKGSYVGGFFGDVDNLSLLLEPEDPQSGDDEIIRIPLETLNEFNCQIEGQSFMVMPYMGDIRSSSVIIVVGNRSYFLTLTENNETLFEQVKKEISEASLREKDKFLIASRFAVDYGVSDELIMEWINNAFSNEETWESNWLKAKLNANMNSWESAIRFGETAQNLLHRNSELSESEKAFRMTEIESSLALWRQRF